MLRLSADRFFLSARRPLGRVLLLAFAVSSALVGARAKDVSAQAFDVPAGGLEAALKTFSAQSGQQVLAPTELVRGLRAPAVKGVMSPRSAIDRLLAGTPLAATFDAALGAFAIVRRAAADLRPRKHAAAIIVVGLATDPGQEARLWESAEAARFGFSQRGFPADQIVFVPAERTGKASRETLFGVARAVKPDLEETWVVLLGNAAPGRAGQPSFQVSGPRVSAGDLAECVKGLPGRRHVVIATPRSGGFLPALEPLPDLAAVAATAADGELDEPRFAAFWAHALGESPEATFRELALDAAARVRAYCVEHSIGEGEHAQLIDRTSGQIISAPFDAVTGAAAKLP